MLKADNAVLVVIDVQGKLATLMHEREAFYDAVVRMIRGAQVMDLPILWNEQIPEKLGLTIDQVKEALQDSEPLVKKHFSCCGNEAFQRKLEETGRKQVLLVGMETHVCVWQTAQDLLDQGYEVYIVADGVSSRSAANKEVGIRAMMQAGARITCVEMALFEMMHVAEGDQFRQLIKIIK